MDGEDVMKVEVYKERREHWKGGGKKREREKKESKQCNYLYKSNLLRRAGRGIDSPFVL